MAKYNVKINKYNVNTGGFDNLYPLVNVEGIIDFKSGIAPQIIATADTGSTVTCSNDGTVLTKVTVDNRCVFDIPNYGVWKLKATKGSDSAEGEVVVSKVKIYRVNLSYKPVASLNPTPGVSYVNGLAGLTPKEISLFGQAISSNSSITNKTTTVYIDSKIGNRKLFCGLNGDQVNIALNGTNYLFDIIGFNHDSLSDAFAYGDKTTTGKAGFTFQMHNLWSEYKPMNNSNTNSGGWRASMMRTQTMLQMKGYMPGSWQGVIKKVNKISGVGNGASSGTETTSDDFFLLSEGEIFGVHSYAFADEVSKTPQYAWYRAGNSKVKKKAGSAYFWWERSAFSGNSGFFCYVNTPGTASGNPADFTYGVAPGFCV